MKTNLFFVFGLCLLGSLVSVPITTVSDDNGVATRNSEMGAVQKDENNNVVGVAANMMGKVVTSSDVESQMVHLKKTTSSSVSSKNEEGVKSTRVARQEPEDEDDDDDEIIDFFGDDDDDSGDDDDSDESAAAVKEEDEEEDEEDDIFSVIGSLLDDDEEDESDDDDKTSVSVTLSQPSAAASSEVVAETAENEIAGNSVEQPSVIDDVSNIEDSTRIKNTAEGENPVLMTPNQQSVQSNAQAISSTNNNQGSSNETSDNDDDDDDDDEDEDEDEDDDLVLGDDADDDDDEDDDDDDDEGDLEGAILDARHARNLNNDNGQNSVSASRYPVQIDKFNKLFDTVVSRLNKELKKKYDPAVVKLTTTSKRKKNRMKDAKKKSAISHRSEMEQNGQQSTLSKDETLETKENVAKPARLIDNVAKDTNQKKKSKNNSNNTKATLYGLSSLRRISDMKVNVRSDYTTVNGDFAFGPLVLRVEKEYGKGLQRDIRSATASTEEMYGTLKLKLSPDGVANLQSIKVYQPKLVRIESDGNHDKTREFLWKRSSDIAPIVSRTLSNVAKAMMSESSNTVSH